MVKNAKMQTHFDALIVGAGLSGIGLACHLRMKCPDKSFAILEARETMGGTWDLFRYPGIRSDSDMSTMAYGFKPWDGEKDIASGQAILDYLRRTAADLDVERHIRYSQSVQQAEWSTADARWNLSVRQASGETVQYSCNMLLSCAGYYSYERGYSPDFKGVDVFRGKIVHPQHWPENLDYAGKDIVVIGSGATAVTLVPALAQRAKHTVMLQRSPTYMLVRPDVTRLSRLLRRLLPAKWAHAILRRWNSRLGHFLYQRSRTHPARVKRFLLKGVRQQLGDDYDLNPDFVPPYDPWDQRLCLVPNGDFFQAINAKQASIVTAHIDRFTEQGILLKSGQELKADIIVTATGLNMSVQGGMQFFVDGQAVDIAQTFTYKGMMNSGVPNLVTTFGYINASWTLRSDMIAGYVCRLLQHMDRIKVRQVTPRLTSEEEDMPQSPFIADFSANYMQRSLHLLPKQGDREPWINPQDYEREKILIGRATFDDEHLLFDNPLPNA